jgi:hypothetical protein
MSKKETSTALAEQTASTALAVPALDSAAFFADAGAGMEGASQESFAIPFLSVLQKGSPQVDESVDGGAHIIDGAKAGMLFENVGNRVYDGKKGLLVVPCHYRRVFIHWGARGTPDGGFKGELTETEVARLRETGQLVEDTTGKLLFPLPGGVLDDKKCARVADTRNHYVLILDEETGAWTQAVLSLTSTQIKKSKNLMSILANVKVRNPSTGALVQPPTFANVVRIQSVAESNDKGSWYGLKFALEGQVQRADLYAAAKEFYQTVAKGSVAVKYEEDGAPRSSGTDDYPSKRGF